jgi:alpha-D-xyloside xylohydrolase
MTNKNTSQERKQMPHFVIDGNALTFTAYSQLVRIKPWGRDSLRVRATMAPALCKDWPGALLPAGDQQAEIEVDGEQATIRNGQLTCHVSLNRVRTEPYPEGRLCFLHTQTGRELLAEQPLHFVMPGARYFLPVGGDLYRLEARFKAYEGERFYGLGQHQHGLLDQKGAVIDLLQRNTEVCIPFLYSTRGYGFLWNNPAVGRVELAANATRWVAEATPQLDYWLTAGDTPAEVMENYADATGHPPLFPEWAAGFWQCKLRYRTQEELLGVAREYKRRGLPLSIIVIDFFHGTLMGDWQFDPECWPDPTGMVRELEEMGVKVMVSIWPTVNARSDSFPLMQEKGWLVQNVRGVAAHSPFVDNKPDGMIYIHFYDATHPDARKFVWDKVRQNYYNHGVRVFWLDADEPELYPMDPDNVRYYLGDGRAVTNIYPRLHNQGFFEGLRAEGETEIITLSRSAWAGSQRYGAAVWSGDVASTFEALQAQVRAGLNMALSGIPWWTTDIGGFHGGDGESPYFRELIVRWFQYGAFCPIFRLHGFREPSDNWRDTGGPNEVWSFGDEAYAIIRDLLFLRERLRPYLMDQMALAHEKGVPPMRPLFFDFPQDEETCAVADAFLFGPDLLVAPVLEEGAVSRSVYLPGAATWTDAWTGQAYPGGAWIQADAPLDRIPLYLRDGARLPIRGS